MLSEEAKKEASEASGLGSPPSASEVPDRFRGSTVCGVEDETVKHADVEHSGADGSLLEKARGPGTAPSARGQGCHTLVGQAHAVQEWLRQGVAGGGAANETRGRCKFRLGEE